MIVLHWNLADMDCFRAGGPGPTRKTEWQPLRAEDARRQALSWLCPAV